MIKELKLNLDEINRIMKIWKEATIKAHPFISKEYWLENYDVIKEKYIPIAETYVYLEEEILGFISIINKEFIGALFVDPNCQGKGIGEKLIKHAKEKYINLTLTVYKENEKAVGFYKKVGFVVKGDQLNEDTNKIEYIMSLVR